jgi:tetratricopeptide (TPR) repeat protein
MSKKSRARAAAKAAAGARAPAAVGVAPIPGPKKFVFRRGHLFLAGGLVVLAALAAYHNSFSGPFILDDRSAIADNPSIKRIGTVFRPSPHATTGGRPMLNFTYAINYAIGGVKVGGYHAFNLLVHALAGLTLFGIVRRTLLRPAFAGLPPSRRSTVSTGPPQASSGLWRTSRGAGPAREASTFDDATPLALAVAVIWVVHPIQTEAVTYISERAESLMGLFYLLTLYGFIRGADERNQEPGVRSREPEMGERGIEFKDQKPRIGSVQLSPARLLAPDSWLLLSIVSCLLGVLSKEVIVTAPAMVFLYDRTFIAGSFREAWRSRWRYYLGLAATWLPLAFLMTGLSQRGVGYDERATAWHYALTSCRSIVFYCTMVLWPHPLILDYGTYIIQRPAEAAPYALVLAALLVAVGFALRFRPVLGFLGAWFFLILAPTSSVVPIAFQPMAEHRLYLSLAAVVALVVVGLYRFIGRSSLAVCAAAAVVLGGLTAQRNDDYRSEVGIWTDNVTKCPNNERAHNSLGNAWLEIPGHLADAIPEFEKSLRLKPDYAEAHYNLAVALGKAGRVAEAIPHYQEALRLKPDYAEAHKNLGSALADLPGRLDEAIGHFEVAVRINPDDAEARNNLGGALAHLPNRVPDAIAQLEASIRLNPDLAGAHYNLGVVLGKIPGRLSDAIAEYETVIRIDRDNADAHYNLGLIFAKIPGKISDAIAEYQAAVRSNPNNLDAHCQLAGLLSAIPERESEAVSEYEVALRIKPDFAEVRLNLGVLLARTPGRQSDAIAEYEAALKINPNFPQAHTDLGILLETIPGRLPEAVKHFEAALKIAPDSPGARENLLAARQALEKAQNRSPQ